MKNQIWLNTSVLKLTDYRGQGMSYEWIIIGQVRESLTPGHKEEDKLEGLE
jgi:hypothetical protein